MNNLFSFSILGGIRVSPRRRASIAFMALAGKGHRRNIVLPVDFDLDVHLALYPLEKYGFNSNLRFSKDKIYYFLALLSTIPARNKDLIDEDGWVPITISYIRKNIRDIISYKDYLVNTGVLECYATYIPGVKSMQYRWNEQYIQSGFHICNVTCSHEEDVYFIQEENDEKFIELPYLYHWYEEKRLSINPIVSQYSDGILQYKMEDKGRWNKNKNTNKLKHPLVQYMAALININKIENHRYEVHIDSTVHRLHSVITNIEKDYRNFLTYNEQELVSIDISNSQPYLACVLLKPEFWSIRNELSLSLYSLPEDIQRAMTTVAIPLKVEGFFQTCSEEDFAQYLDIASSGNMYETVAEVCQHSLHKSIDRDEAKVLMFYLFFSSNQGQHDDATINQMKKIFSTELFPKVAELFKIIKHRYKDIAIDKQHNRLSCLLQSIESEIILHRCCKRIWEEGNPQVPVFTIHDSIATTTEHVEWVKGIMQEELTNAIGVSPSLTIEHWNLSKVKHPNILQRVVQE